MAIKLQDLVQELEVIRPGINKSASAEVLIFDLRSDGLKSHLRVTNIFYKINSS
jgi:hypothetical protein